MLKKDDRIIDLEQDISKKAKSIKELLEQVSQLSFECATSKDQVSTLTSKAAQLETQVADLSYELSQNTQALKETETACMQAVDESQRMAAEVARLSGELGTVNRAVQNLTDQVNQLEGAQDKLNQEINARDQRIIDLQEAYHALEIKNVKDIEDALARLTEMMENTRQESLAKLRAEMEQHRVNALQEKTKELESLSAKLMTMTEDFDNRMQQVNSAFEQQKAELLSNIEDLENAKADLENKLKATTASLEERVAEVGRHQSTIHHQSSTIKSLEVDKADLFQKMVHIDRQIRGEMFEKFQKEKSDLEASLRDVHHADIESLKGTLRSLHDQELQVAVLKIKAYYIEEIDTIKAENQAKLEGFLAEMSEKEAEIAQLKREKEELEQSIDDAKQMHAKALADVHAEFQKLLSLEKSKWEGEAQSRETQLKVASTLALANLEKRNTTALADLEATHKKQIDELRSFHTISALAAKKEAETQRQMEIGRIKTTHSDQIMTLMQERDKMLAEQMATLVSQRESEIRVLTTEFNETVEERDAIIKGHLREIAEKQENIDMLDVKVQSLEAQVVDVKRALHDTIETMKQRDADARKRLEEQATQFEAQLKQELELLRTEHVRELQLMLQDFEKAKTYLKKQIANHQKLLQDAEVKYINREPRDVDLQRIAELEQMVAEEQRKCAVIGEELGYFKLEMNNREASFNKIFNKAPLVGLMQPLAVSQKGGKLKHDNAAASNPKLPPLYSLPSNAGTPPDLAYMLT
ncbi:hypothetical protein BC831DRAFT_302057 [Entophlyctis helioformis]|nr:hypothetical protein BC831DRAFT_302057 [Entophlyctis helioformis]